MPYSERFLINFGSGTWSSYNVPAGRRAVVRCLTFVNSDTESHTCIVTVGGATIYSQPLPGLTSVVVGELRVVGYEGEPVNAFSSGPASVVTVSGYLLADPIGRSDDSREVPASEIGDQEPANQLLDREPR